MTLRDSAGHDTTGATSTALESYELAAHQFRCLIDDPVASVDAAIAAAPGMTMAYVLKAWLNLLGTEPAGLPVARDCVVAARALPATQRERGHLDAIEQLLGGYWRRAGRVLEDVSAAYPRDALALHAGHQIDFFTGDSRMLRDRIARALPSWNASMPGYAALLGMYAFGLEECGECAAAERYGRESVERERRGSWSWHAVAHVYEMQVRPDAGIAWLRSDVAGWSEANMLARHNWWHLALFHLEREEYHEVLRLYDGPFWGTPSAVILELIDASAMLWRLELHGVDVGDRWQSVADAWAAHATAGNYGFNDLHAMLAFAGAARPQAREAVLGSLRAAVSADGDVGAFAREVALDASRAVDAWARGRYAECVALLRPLRSYAHRFGGSHAQRDLIDQTLLVAARRAGMHAYAEALGNERRARRPSSPLLRAFSEPATQRTAA